MLNYDTDNRLQEAQSHADRLAEEMRRSRGLAADEIGFPRWGRLAAELLARAESLRRGTAHRAPALHR